MADKVVGDPQSSRDHRDIVPRRFVSLSQQHKKEKQTDRYKRECENKETPPNKILRRAPAWIEALATVAIVGLTLALVRITTEQKVIADRANQIMGQQTIVMEAANQTQRAANRAFIYFGRPVVVLDSGDGKPVYGVDIPVVNSGATPSGNLRVLVDCAISDGNQSVDPFALPRVEGRTLEGMYLGPEQTFPKNACILTNDQFEDTKIGKTQVFVVAEARYLDVFEPVERITQFVHRLLVDKSNRISTRPVGRHNCSDKDCP